MGATQFFRFSSTQSQKVLIMTQLMTHNSFQKMIQINSRLKKHSFLEFDSNRLMTQTGFHNLYSNQLMTQKVFQNLDLNQLMAQKTFQNLIQIDL